MSSNRLIYDTCAYKKELDQSTGSFSYSMYPGKYENCAKCRIELGQVGGNGVSIYSGNLVDLESDLRGQTKPASLCPQYHYQPQCNGENSNCDGLPCNPKGLEFNILLFFSLLFVILLFFNFDSVSI